MAKILLERSSRLAERVFNRNRVKVPNSEYQKIIKCSSGTISNYKRGITPIPLEAAIDIANASGMTDEEWLALRRVK